LRDLGQNIWRRLSDLLGVPVSKRNLRVPITDLATQSTQPAQPSRSIPDPHTEQYIDRPPVEKKCCAALREKGLVRIKAPQKMGKTLLLNKILNFAQSNQYHVVRWDLDGLSELFLDDIDALWQEFCRHLTRKLGLEDRRSEFWDTALTSCSNTKCTEYLEDYLLPSLAQPLVLGLDNCDALFPHSGVATEFFKVLRTWYNNAANDPTWQKLRMVVVHATDIYAYPVLDINISPFNVGYGQPLREFSAAEVAKLAGQYHRAEDDLTPLIELVGGHPFLLCEALEYFQQYPELALTELATDPALQLEIYRNHLAELSECLRQNEPLAVAMKAAVAADEPITVGEIERFKLESLGLVQSKGYEVTPRCQLYRSHFGRVL
jgi:hypothetical protein